MLLSQQVCKIKIIKAIDNGIVLFLEFIKFWALDYLNRHLFVLSLFKLFMDNN